MEHWRLIRVLGWWVVGGTYAFVLLEVVACRYHLTGLLSVFVVLFNIKCLIVSFVSSKSFVMTEELCQRH